MLDTPLNKKLLPVLNAPFIVVAVKDLPIVTVAPDKLLFPIIISPVVCAPPISIFASVIFEPIFNVVEVVTGSKSLNITDYNNQATIIGTGTGGTGGTYYLPLVTVSTGYTFTFRSVQATKTMTISKSDATNTILLASASGYSTADAVASYTVSSGASKTFICDGAFWVQV